MSSERQQLEAAIAALQSQRALLGDAAVEAVLAPLQSRLAALRELPGQALKLVSILFLDVSGSTRMGQQLDPEDIQAVMDVALARFTALVEQQQGRVLQYAGDSLLAVFGADGAREDDAEHAVRAGLALLAEGERHAGLVRERFGLPDFRVRVGIHSGGVLLGGGVDQEGTIRGAAVNIAARMEQSAPPGGLRISHDTLCHVRGIFKVTEEEVQVKGLDAPMRSYLVHGVKPRAFKVATRGIEGIETRMVGRDAELEQLQLAFKRLYTQGGLHVLTVVSEAGLGKSRLLYEFENWAEARSERFVLFQGRAHPHTQSQPYGLLRDILAWRLQILDDDSMDEAKRKLQEQLLPLFATADGAEQAEAQVHLLGHLIGLDFADSRHIRGIREDGRQLRNRGFHAAAQLFRRVGAERGVPVLLVLDDLHWADAGSLDFLNYLAQVAADMPLLALALTRPTLFERRRDWSGIEGRHQRIELAPLSRDRSRELANELLKKLPEVPAALRELITGGSEGNPFYMEELVKMLVDEGAIETGGESWVLHPDRLMAAQVPQTLTGVLQARLDSLRPLEKLALQEASAIGFVFWDQALNAIDRQSGEALPGVLQRELVVRRQDAALEGVREYAFKHQILHQVTYNTVLKRTRREYHAKAALWLAGLSGARANDFLGVAAEHFEKAGESAMAAEYFTRAAEHAAGRYAHEAALAYVAQALALPVALDPQHRWRLLAARERTLDLLGQREEQRADIEALVELAETLDDDQRRGEAAWRRCDFGLRTADYAMMAREARRALSLAERAGSTALGLRARQRLAAALSLAGDQDGARAMAEQGLAEARVEALPAIEAMFLNALSFISSRQDRRDSAAEIELHRSELAILRQLGNRASEATVLSNLGGTWLALGANEQARADLEASLQLARADGNRAPQCYALVNLAVLALRLGDDALALGHAHAALAIAVEVRERQSEAHALLRLGEAELALGRESDALAALRRSLAVGQEIGDPIRFDAMSGLARVALARGDAPAALNELAELLAHLDAGGGLDGCESPRRIELSCILALQACGDPRALTLLKTARAELLAQAEAIRDAAQRRAFLDDIPEHRKLAELELSAA